MGANQHNVWMKVHYTGDFRTLVMVMVMVILQDGHWNLTTSVLLACLICRMENHMEVCLWMLFYAAAECYLVSI